MASPRVSLDGKGIERPAESLSASTSSRKADTNDLMDQLAQLKLGGSNSRTPPRVVAASPRPNGKNGSPAPQGTIHSRESSFGVPGSPANARLHVTAALTPPKAAVMGMGEERAARERPHSYSGGLSAADLKRLQTDGSSADSDGSLSRGTTPLTARPPKQWPLFTGEDANYTSLNPNTARGINGFAQASGLTRPDDSNHTVPQPLQLGAPPIPQPLPAGAPRINQTPTAGGFGRGMPTNPSFSQSNKSYSPSLQSNMSIQPLQGAYGFAPGQHQQSFSVYDLMPIDPTVARIQQQHGAGPGFRPAHGHSQSDPSGTIMPDPATLALLGGMPAAFGGPAMYSPPPGALSHQIPHLPNGAMNLYGGAPMPGSAGLANQFFAPQELYAQADGALNVAARLQQQYLANAYGQGMHQPPNAALNQLAAASANLQAAAVAAVAAANATATATAAGVNGTGPSANNRKLGLYKTELCRSWEEKGTCRYGTKCQFAHGEDEIRDVSRHPKYKTEICRTFWVSGSCPYGKRCCFVHTDMPPGQGPPGADGTPPPNMVFGDHSRTRSSSTTSGGDSSESSMLQRFSAQRAQGVPASMSQTSTVSIEQPITPTSPYPLSARPGGLRVDTASLNSASHAKENKSAYPTFPQASNPLLAHAAPEPASALSPLPATAHPEFGARHGLSRLDLGAASQAKTGKSSSPNNRHSFNGTDLGLDFSSISSLVTPVQTTGPSFGRVGGHMRSGSAGNWSSLTRPSRLSSATFSPIPSADLQPNSPWGSEMPISNSNANGN